jgi:predicted lipid-binding transport protein (Tim44 family)
MLCTSKRMPHVINKGVLSSAFAARQAGEHAEHAAALTRCLQDDKAAFAQLTLRVRAVHTFAAYDADGRPVAGDAAREVPVQDVWVFERFLTPGPTARWRVAGAQKLTALASLILQQTGACSRFLA